jgi:tRNA(Ile)-lysidine synthase
VRHDVLPLLKQFNPAILDALARQADILREDNRYLDHLAEEQCARVAREAKDQKWVVDRSDLLALDLAVQRRVIRKVVQRTAAVNRGPSFAAVSLVLERVVHGDSGSCATLRHVCVSREYDTIVFQRLGDMPCGTLGTSALSVARSVPFTVSWPLTGQRLQADLVHSSQSDQMCAPLSPMRAMLDADRLTLELHVRAWRPGDRFHPFGFDGHRKKLQDFFADLKVPRSAREGIPLVVAPEGIVWVAGYRTDHRFRVMDSTRRILRLTLLDGESRELA